MNALRAIGDRPGDSLVITNQWASVHIAVGDDGEGFVVGGEPQCSREPFATFDAACEEAWRVLSLYADGRAD